MRTKLFILSVVICLILCTITAQAEVTFGQENSYFQTFPDLTKGENQISFNRQSNGLTLNNKIWDKTKKVWNGPATDVVKKVTGTSRGNIFVWSGIHSFFDAITDAKAHSRGNTKYFSGDGDWHMWKNGRDFSAVMLTLNFARRIFIEKITVKQAIVDLSEIGVWRFVLFNTNMKIVKGGFSAYNDPHYNQHTLPYWGFENGKFTDKYIATGRFTTPLCDGLALTVLIIRWSNQSKDSIAQHISITDLATRRMLVLRWAL